MSAAGSDERSRPALERARNYAADHVGVAQSAGYFTNMVKLIYRNNFLVGGNLKHGIGRGVADWAAGFNMLFAELLDYRSSGRSLVAQDFSSGFTLESLDKLRRKTTGIRPETQGRVCRGQCPPAPSDRLWCPFPGDDSAMTP